MNQVTDSSASFLQRISYWAVEPKWTTSDYETYGKTSILTPALTNQTNFAKNEAGSIFVGGTAGVLGVIPNDSISEDGLFGYLNSTLIGAFLKASAPSKANGYYQLSEDLLNTIPIPTEFDNIGNIASNIRSAVEKENKIQNFPEAYLGGYDGELDYIDYEWQTRRYPVDAAIQEKTDGRLAVTAGRSDEITDPLLDAGDREASRLRARYVHAAVDGRNVKSGEETTIPMPSRRDGVEELMAALEDDEATVAETSIEELEADIDAAVYDLFDLTDEERSVIEEYLEVF